MTNVRHEAAERILVLNDDDPGFIARLVNFPYSADYADDHHCKSNKDDEIVQLWKVHVVMYALAERCDITGLKEVSAEKFNRYFDRPAIFAEVGIITLNGMVSIIYDSTPKNDANQRLREFVAKQIQLYIVVLPETKKFKSIVEDNKNCGSDVITATSRP